MPTIAYEFHIPDMTSEGWTYLDGNKNQAGAYQRASLPIDETFIPNFARDAEFAFSEATQAAQVNGEAVTAAGFGYLDLYSQGGGKIPVLVVQAGGHSYIVNAKDMQDVTSEFTKWLFASASTDTTTLQNDAFNGLLGLYARQSNVDALGTRPKLSKAQADLLHAVQVQRIVTSGLSVEDDEGVTNRGLIAALHDVSQLQQLFKKSEIEDAVNEGFADPEVVTDLLRELQRLSVATAAQAGKDIGHSVPISGAMFDLPGIAQTMGRGAAPKVDPTVDRLELVRGIQQRIGTNDPIESIKAWVMRKVAAFPPDFPQSIMELFGSSDRQIKIYLSVVNGHIDQAGIRSAQAGSGGPEIPLESGAPDSVKAARDALLLAREMRGALDQVFGTGHDAYNTLVERFADETVDEKGKYNDRALYERLKIDPALHPGKDVAAALWASGKAGVGAVVVGEPAADAIRDGTAAAIAAARQLVFEDGAHRTFFGGGVWDVLEGTGAATLASLAPRKVVTTDDQLSAAFLVAQALVDSAGLGSMDRPGGTGEAIRRVPNVRELADLVRSKFSGLSDAEVTASIDQAFEFLGISTRQAKILATQQATSPQCKEALKALLKLRFFAIGSEIRQDSIAGRNVALAVHPGTWSNSDPTTTENLRKAVLVAAGWGEHDLDEIDNIFTLVPRINPRVPVDIDPLLLAATSAGAVETIWKKRTDNDYGERRYDQLTALGAIVGDDAYPTALTLGLDVLATARISDPGQTALAESLAGTATSVDYGAYLGWLGRVGPEAGKGDPAAPSDDLRSGQLALTLRSRVLGLVKDLDPSFVPSTTSGILTQQAIDKSRFLDVDENPLAAPANDGKWFTALVAMSFAKSVERFWYWGKDVLVKRGDGAYTKKSLAALSKNPAMTDALLGRLTPKDNWELVNAIKAAPRDGAVVRTFKNITTTLNNKGVDHGLVTLLSVGQAVAASKIERPWADVFVAHAALAATSYLSGTVAVVNAVLTIPDGFKTTLSNNISTRIGGTYDFIEATARFVRQDYSASEYGSRILKDAVIFDPVTGQQLLFEDDVKAILRQGNVYGTGTGIDPDLDWAARKAISYARLPFAVSQLRVADQQVLMDAIKAIPVESAGDRASIFASLSGRLAGNTRITADLLRPLSGYISDMLSLRGPGSVRQRLRTFAERLTFDPDKYSDIIRSGPGFFNPSGNPSLVITDVNGERTLAFAKEDHDLRLSESQRAAVTGFAARAHALNVGRAAFNANYVIRAVANLSDLGWSGLGIAFFIKSIVEGIKAGNRWVISLSALGVTSNLAGLAAFVLEVSKYARLASFSFWVGAIISTVASLLALFVDAFKLGPSQDKKAADYAKSLLEPFEGRFLVDDWKKILDRQIIAPAQ
jgi:hypothetical protein